MQFGNILRLGVVLATIAAWLVACSQSRQFADGVSYNPSESAAIEGTVIDSETGEPVDPAFVYLEISKVGVQPNADGYFRTDKVRLGKQNIQVHGAGYEREILVVEVLPGQTTSLEVRLKKTDASRKINVQDPCELLFLQVAEYNEVLGESQAGMIMGAALTEDTTLNTIGVAITLVGTLRGSLINLAQYYQITNVPPGAYCINPIGSITDPPGSSLGMMRRKFRVSGLEQCVIVLPGCTTQTDLVLAATEFPVEPAIILNQQN